MSYESAPAGGMTHFIGKTIVRSLQFLMGAAVAGLYAVHLDDQHKKGQPYNTLFLYAVAIGGLSALTAAIYAIPKVRWRVLWFWDLIVCLNWLVVFGIFGKLFLKRPDGPANAYEGTHTSRMRNAVWLDVANAGLWAASAIYGIFIFFKARREAKLYAQGYA